MSNNDGEPDHTVMINDIESPEELNDNTLSPNKAQEQVELAETPARAEEVPAKVEETSAKTEEVPDSMESVSENNIDSDLPVLYGDKVKRNIIISNDIDENSPTVDFDKDKIKSQITHKVYLVDKSMYIIVQNNSIFDLSWYLTLSYYDAQGNIKGIKNDTIYSLESDSVDIVSISFDDPPADYILDFSVEKSLWVCKNSEIKYSSISIDGNDEIVTLENISDDSIGSRLVPKVLFLKDGEVVDYASGRINKSSLNPGETDMCQISSSYEYDNAFIVVEAYNYY